MHIRASFEIATPVSLFSFSLKCFSIPPVYVGMERHDHTQNRNFTFLPAFTDTDKKLMMLYHDICDYFGWPAGQDEQAGPNLSDPHNQLDYLLAISG
jgi:hypothetical protein